MNSAVKKIISVTLTVLLISGLVPFSAIADRLSFKQALTAFALDTGSGECGQSLTWSLSDSGTLVISGTGAMYDYDPGAAPWYEATGSIRAVSVENGVTSIGSNAFRYCAELKTVSIAATVTGIGACAFEGCDSLEGVYISDLAAWCGIVFADRSANPLESGHLLYLNGKLLEKLVIPSSVKNINDFAFARCESITELSVPGTVDRIGEMAFDCCSNLTSAVMSGNVSVIGISAFSGCILLKDVVLSEETTEICNMAFLDCWALEYIRLSAKVEFVEDAFVACPKLSRIDVDINNRFYSSENGILYNKDKTQLILYPAGITESVYRLPSGLSEIRPNAFNSQNKYLQSFDAGENTLFLTVDDVLFNRDKTELILYPGARAETEYSVPDGIERIADQAFSCCESLEKIHFPEGLSEIGLGAFIGCNLLEEVRLPDSVIDIGPMAFQDCFELKEIELGQHLEHIGAAAFCDCGNLKNIVIPPSVKDIGDSAFDNSAVTSIAIPDSVEYLGGQAFMNCAGLRSVSVGDGVSAVWDRTFYGCAELTDVSLGDGIQSIGSEAFSGCKKLEFIELPEGVTEICHSAFRDCAALQSISIYDRADRIGELVFDGCPKVTVRCVAGSAAQQYAENNDIPYLTISKPAVLEVILRDENGDKLTGGYFVKWYAPGGSSPAAIGSKLYNAFEAEEYSYEVVLGEELAGKYQAPARGSMKGGASSVMECVLEPVGAMTVRGAVVDENGDPVKDVTVKLTQTLNEIHTETSTVTTNDSGEYTAKVLKGRVTAEFSAEGYYRLSAAVCGADTDGDELFCGTSVLKKLPGSSLRLSLFLCNAEGDTVAFSRPSDLAFSVYNNQKKKELKDFTCQYPDLFFSDGTVSPGDELTVTVEDTAGAAKTEAVKVYLDDRCCGSAEIVLTENGRIRAGVNDREAVMFVFDEQGKPVGKYRPNGTEILSDPLGDGSYTAVLMQSAGPVSSLSSLGVLDLLGLKEDEDLIRKNVAVESGKISDLGTVTVPVADTDARFTVPGGASFTANADTATVGGYVAMKAEYELDGRYADAGSQTVRITIPENVTVVGNSVTVDGKPCSYAFEDGMLEVGTGPAKGAVRFSIAALKEGVYVFNAVLTFTVGGADVSQSLGALTVTAENASMTVPSVTPTPQIPIRGKALPGSGIRLFDNDREKASAAAKKNGEWSAELTVDDADTLSEHIIKAVITTPEGVEYTLETNVLYDPDACVVSRVTVVNTAHPNTSDVPTEYRTTIDYLASDDTKHVYKYWPEYPEFTFIVEILGAAENVNTVNVVTYDAADTAKTVPCLYDPGTGTWVGTEKYLTYETKPASICVAIDSVSAAEGSRIVLDGEDPAALPETADIAVIPPEECESMTVGAVSPATGSAGDVTVCVTGTLLRPDAEVVLANGDLTLAAKKTYWRSHQTMFATFDLRTAPDGVYDVAVRDDDTTAVLEDCFTVDKTLPGGRTKVVLNEGSAVVENIGYTDVPAPVILVKGGYNGGNSVIALDGENYNEYIKGLEIYEIGIETIVNSDRELSLGQQLLFLQNRQGLAGTLAPGQIGCAEFEFTRYDAMQLFEAPSAIHAGNGAYDRLRGILCSHKYSWTDMNGNEALFSIRPAQNADELLFQNALTLMGNSKIGFARSAASMANELSCYMDDVSLNDIFGAFAIAGSGALGVSEAESVTDLDAGALTLQRSFSNLLIGPQTRLDAGIFGFGWSADFDAQISFEHDKDTDTDVAVLHGGNTEQRFSRKGGSGVYLSESGDGASVKVSEDGIVLTSRAGEEAVFNSDGSLLCERDRNGNETEYVREGGVLKSIRTRTGDELAFTYEDGKVVSAVSAATGDTVTYGYDRNRLVSVTTKYGTTKYAYSESDDIAKRNTISRISYADGSTKRFAYDHCGRVVTVVNDEYIQNINYDLLTVTATDNAGSAGKTVFDGKGQIRQTVDADGNVTVVSYDENGHIVSVGDGVTAVSAFTYNESGDLLTSSTANGSVTSYSYNEKGDLTGVTNAAGVTTGYVRDDRGNNTAIVYPDGSRETFEYDEKGLLTSYVSRGGVTVGYSYDDRENVTEERYGTGETVRYEYDKFGDLTCIDENGQITQLEYDDKGALKAVTYPTGETVRYTCDALGRRTSVTGPDGFTTGYAYGLTGRLAAVTDGTDTLISYEYGADGSLNRQVNANGTSTEYAYDRGRLASIVNLDANGETISSRSYTYGRDGLISSMTDGEGTWRYGYDAAGQLSYAVSPAGETTVYGYDAAGNRTSVTKGRSVTEYETNELDQYVRIGDETREYDADGNLIREISPEGEATYGWDYRGLLVKYTAADGAVCEYGYDAFGLRNSVTVNGSVTTYLNDPTGYGFAVSSTDGAGTSHYRIANGVSAMERDGTEYFFHADHLGSVSGITGSGGDVVSRYAYDQDGSVIFAEEGVANPYTYAGIYGIVNDRNGLIYDRARYVSETSDSFISVDPCGQAFDINIYRYVNNNAVSAVDISGEVANWIIAAAVGFVVGGLLIGVVNALYQYNQKGYIDWKEVFRYAFWGGVAGALIGLGLYRFVPGFRVFIDNLGLKLTFWLAVRFPKTKLNIDVNNIPKSKTKLLFKSPKLQKEYNFNQPKWEFEKIKELTKIFQRVIGKGSFLPWIIPASIIFPGNSNSANASEIPPANYITPNTTLTGKPDPSGYVYAGVTSNRLEGVKASIWYFGFPTDLSGEPDRSAGMQALEWTEAAEYGETDPQFTDAFGQYGWFVPDGRWRVRYEKEGYAEYWSDWMDVPPEYTDVNINLQTLTAPKVKSCRVFPDGARIEFDQYMQLDTVNSGNIIISSGGAPVDGVWKPVNAEWNYERTAQYASVFRFESNAMIEGTATVTAQDIVNYAGIAMTEPFTESCRVEPQPMELRVTDLLSVAQGEDAIAQVQILPTEAGSRRTLTVESLTPSICGCAQQTVTTDAQGIATVRVHGAVCGGGLIRVSLDDSELNAMLKVGVTQKGELDGIGAGEVTADIPGGSIVTKGTQLHLSAETPDAVIWYTTDASDPTDPENPARVRYENAIAIDTDLTVQAYAEAEGMLPGAVAGFSYLTTDLEIVAKLSCGDPLTAVVGDAMTVFVMPGVPIGELLGMLNGAVDVETVAGGLAERTAKVGTGMIAVAANGDRYGIAVPGDIDGDGKVTATDARLALRASARLATLEPICETAADVSGDEKVKAGDARQILRIAARLDSVTEQMLNRQTA